MLIALELIDTESKAGSVLQYGFGYRIYICIGFTFRFWFSIFKIVKNSSVTKFVENCTIPDHVHSAPLKMARKKKIVVLHKIWSTLGKKNVKYYNQD